MKEVKQNLRITHGNRDLKIQFNFCPECKYFADCYEQNPLHPSYISPECADIGQELGYDA
jgi:hypothetical protein